ncbi:MAG: EF-hand domain-containing protein [Proteobacteria bacterium]|nr:EF-hand domain-containing protein [Pseudomonadota bacterium]
MSRNVIRIAIAAGALAAIGSAWAAGEPTQAQIDAAFAKADPDHDGTVSRAEAMRFGISKAAFEHANPDKDGTLDKKEFVEAITWQFNHANPDKDGTLDPKEARKAGIKAKGAFEKADPDKDGTLDLGEYFEALTAQAH